MFIQKVVIIIINPRNYRIPTINRTIQKNPSTNNQTGIDIPPSSNTSNNQSSISDWISMKHPWYVVQSRTWLNKRVRKHSSIFSFHFKRQSKVPWPTSIFLHLTSFHSKLNLNRRCSCKISWIKANSVGRPIHVMSSTKMPKESWSERSFGLYGWLSMSINFEVFVSLRK